MSLPATRLAEIVRELASRPGHENVRVLMAELLRSRFGAPYAEMQHEVYLLDNSGRIDTLWGSTVLEFKKDLRREEQDVIARMPDYLAEAQRRVGASRATLGLATDGATFVVYAMRHGSLAELTRHATIAADPDDLVAWLELQLSDANGQAPDPRAIRQAFGRGSTLFALARLSLDALWADLAADPEVRLKRDLWDGLLREAYGEPVGGDPLFVQHTYLTIVVKAIAACVLALPTDDPVTILDGTALTNAGIFGAVEADFFDWPLKSPDGARLVGQVVAQVARFSLKDVEADVLKTLYESLVDPAERHDLGEYYTPDWLAYRVVAEAVDAPLTQRVLDPACGSGTFLFHALRRLVAAGKYAGWPSDKILTACANQVFGLDVHPVAVTLARVTWLLALSKLLPERVGRLTVPVFLGDAMQWNLRQYIGHADVLVDVPGEPPLQVPTGFAEDQARFEHALDEMNQGLRDEDDPEAVGRRLARIAGATPADATRLAVTFGQMQALYRSGRNGIWTFVLRNLVRPVWLSRPEQRADVLVGNPPWIVYRHLSPSMKDRLREGLGEYGLWVGGHLATQQDMCALFWARGAERYLRPHGRIAFVLPYAVLNAPVFAGLRAGAMDKVRVGVTGGWSLERVWPIFGGASGGGTTSTCVLFGTRDATGPQPVEVDRWVGHLARRDATEFEATLSLAQSRVTWPRARTLIGLSPYRSRFRQGATIVPRRFFVVDPEPVGRLGGMRDAPRMRGRVGKLDKHPWTTVEPPSGPIETQFLRALVLGETIAPYRLLAPVTAVVPLSGSTLLNAASAREAGFRYLAEWLRDIEGKWEAHCNKKADGSPRMTLPDQLDHRRKLIVQSGPDQLRVCYTKAGTRLSAVALPANRYIVDHKAYWSNVKSVEEAAYIVTTLNSAAVLGKITDLQPRGETGARDFDNLVWTLPIPDYDPADVLHRDLAAAGARAEAVAALVSLNETQHFTAKRRAIRAALAEDGIAAEIEALVDALLPP